MTEAEKEVESELIELSMNAANIGWGINYDFGM